MENMPNLNGKHILVMGYALTGKSVIEFLLQKGAQVTLTALEDLSDDASVQAFQERGMGLVDKGHPLTLLDQPWDMIVKNPGIPYHVPLIQAALAADIPIVTDVELASWFNPGRFIGITGSNGKTTTTQLIYNIFKLVKDFETYLAGNIGVPILESVAKAKETDTLVAELSSFQLEGTRDLHPHIAVITNIYQAHLDYHGDIDHYRQAKLKLIQNMTAQDNLVYNYDQEGLHDWIQVGPYQQIPVGMVKVDDYLRQHGMYVEQGLIYFKGQALLPVEEIPIPGQHNVMNVMMAMAAALIGQVPLQFILDGVKAYAGVPHRIQPIAHSQGRRFFNDSKATNTVATITALKSFHQPLVYIGGGLDRGNGFDDLIPYCQHIQDAYLYGETKEKMAQSLEKVGHINIHIVETLQEATLQAYHQAQEGQVVLFSPACASWDQFDNFETRGQAFTDLVYELIASQPYH